MEIETVRKKQKIPLRRHSLQISTQCVGSKNACSTTVTVIPPEKPKRKTSVKQQAPLTTTTIRFLCTASSCNQHNSSSSNWQVKKPQVTFQLVPSHTNNKKFSRPTLSHRIAMPESTTNFATAATAKNYHFIMDDEQHRHLEAEQFQRANAIRNHHTTTRTKRSTTTTNVIQAAGGGAAQQRQHTRARSVNAAAVAATAESTDESPSVLAAQSNISYDKRFKAAKRCGAADYDVAPSTLNNKNNNHRNSQQQAADRSPVVSVDDASTSRGYHSDATGENNNNQSTTGVDTNQQHYLHQPQASAATATAIKAVRNDDDGEAYHHATTHQTSSLRRSASRKNSILAATPVEVHHHQTDDTPQLQQQSHYYYPPTQPPAGGNNYYIPQPNIQQYQQHLYPRPLYATMPSRLPSGTVQRQQQQQQWLTDVGFVGQPLTAAPSYMTLVQLVPTTATGRPIDYPMTSSSSRAGRPMTVRELKKMRKKGKAKGDKNNKDLYATASFRSDWPLPMMMPMQQQQQQPFVMYDPYAAQFPHHHPWAYATMPRAVDANMHHSAADERAQHVPPPLYEPNNVLLPPPPHIVKPARLDPVYFQQTGAAGGGQGMFVPVGKNFNFPKRHSSSSSSSGWWRRMCCKGYALVAWLIALLVLIGITVTIMLLVLFA